ncbi:HAD-superfamily subfamily IIA hydrolase, TIGR01458 [Mesorhizobium albiziae]|uniref:Phospholysine phosphohistidine inorganic pyrophosphate phosphatase n=1 Tax=Neomesorhizobium albiziae TaxID=335020 RepID=A0A1I3ZZQ3_9HYPH|nr:TIGR01458 family HAD-type hydrolase [Mesorhizobium albiziae]GLS33950.1 hydrolase [Mesorhizobium albiziae]SFK49347.1 HAD-superfamily subfamily IIA hydrolase, TIGR01458 [Mesorhizobium albiziae]
MISGVLLDLAGVIYDGDVAIPGAVEAVALLRGMGLPLRFASNTTRSAKQTVLDRLHRLGLVVAKDELFTPAQAACAWLIEHGCSPHLLVHPDLEPDFHGLPKGGKRAVIIGDAGEALDYVSLNAAFRELNDGADFLALAINRTFKDADGRLSLDVGPFVAALEFACQRKATVLGKPSPDFFRAALSSMNCPTGEAVMVGDDAESDVAGALGAGLAAALQVRTGKYRAGDEARFDPRPTAVVDDLKGAAEWIVARRN